MSRKKKPPPMSVVRVCISCGETFETTEDRDRCPGGCRHRWGNGNYDPCAFDDEDANRKALNDESR